MNEFDELELFQCIYDALVNTNILVKLGYQIYLTDSMSQRKNTKNVLKKFTLFQPRTQASPSSRKKRTQSEVRGEKTEFIQHVSFIFFSN